MILFSEKTSSFRGVNVASTAVNESLRAAAEKQNPLFVRRVSVGANRGPVGEFSFRDYHSGGVNAISPPSM